MITLDKNQRDIQIPDYNDLDNKPRINGVELSGDKSAEELGIVFDTKNYYTKSQSDNKFQVKGNYLTEIPSEYITETELNRKDFATNSDVNDEIGKLDSALSVEIDKKQNALVSGENIKTINGISLLGDGNIVITGSGEGGNVDLSDYYTKEQVDELIEKLSVSSISYAVFDYDENDAVNLVAGDISKVFEDYKQHKPIMIFAPIDNTGKVGVVNCLELGSDINYLIGYVSYFDGNSITYRRYVFDHYGTIGYANATKNFIDYYTKGEVNEQINDISTNLADNYYTILEVDELIESAEPNLAGYATETWVDNHYQPKGSYLTSVPSEYVTESELNDAIAGLGGGDVPYVVITTQSATSTTLQYTGDLNGVINAIKNKTPYNAYFYNKATYYGVRYALYEVDFVYYDSTNNNGTFYVHSEGGGGQHRVNNLPFTFDGENYKLGDITYVAENYATVSQLNNKQDTLVSGTNIKTINGESILGSGNIVIEGGSGGNTDLTGYATEDWVSANYQTKGNYATTSYVDTQIGNINTILENIIG